MKIHSSFSIICSINFTQIHSFLWQKKEKKRKYSPSFFANADYEIEATEFEYELIVISSNVCLLLISSNGLNFRQAELGKKNLENNIVPTDS